MQLSKNFWLSELTKSQTATRYGIANTPNSIQIANLKNLCEKILQPTRDHFQKPVIISSGFRSPFLNARIGGAQPSQHSFGEAADFEIPGLGNKQVAEWIKEKLDFDQIILEFYEQGKPNSGWIHCSLASRERRQPNRRQAMIFSGVRYQLWN